MEGSKLPVHAGADIMEHIGEGIDIAVDHVRPEGGQEDLIIYRAGEEKQGEIGFVERGTGDPALPVKAGQCVEREQEQA